MGTSWFIALRELRWRWSSLVGMTLLVAIVSGVLLTALVGAYRTSTSIDRFRSWAGASDVVYQSSDSELAAHMVAALEDNPDVEVAGVRNLVNAFVMDESGTDIAVLTDPAGVVGVELDRPRLIAGRYPRDDAPDEVLLNEVGARVTDLGVGDTLAAQTWSEQDLEVLFDPLSDFPGFNGPELELQVVGIGRTPEELPGDTRRGGLYAMGSPSFLEAYGGVGAWPPAVVVQLRDGADVEDVTEALGRELVETELVSREEVEFLSPTTAAEVYLDTTERTVDSLSLGLLIFAAGATVAGAIAVGPAVTRQIAGSSASVRSLEALGLTRSETALALSLPIVGAGVLGVALGGAVAVAASPLLPLGLARRAEIDPGVWVQPGILAAGGVAIVLGVSAWSFRVARRPGQSSSGVSAEARRVSFATRAAARLGASPPVVTGVHLASDRGRLRGSVPVRSAFVGLTIGVAGVLGAGVIVTSLHGLTSQPANWGWNWSTLPDYFGDGEISELETRLLDDDRVEAVADYVAGSVLVNGTGLTSYSMTPLKGSITFTRLDGRLPSGPGEVAFGRQTMDDLDVSIGDTVEAAASDGSARDLVVVGTVVLPPTEEYRLGVGAVFTPEGREALEQGDPLSSLALQYPEGVDVAALEDDLAADYGFTFSLFAQAQAPGSIRYLREERDLAVALGAFFVVIGAVGLWHALSVSTKRRRGDLAVLRSLGFRRSQVRRTISTEALALTTAGVVVGVPLGLIVGRFIWRALVDDLGVVSDPRTPWPVIGVTIVAALVIAVLVSWWPGRSAVRTCPAEQLRAE